MIPFICQVTDLLDLQCSASCGKGVMSRFVFCASHKRDRWVEVPERRCKEEKPETMQSCGNGPCETGTWMTGDWSEVRK